VWLNSIVGLDKGVQIMFEDIKNNKRQPDENFKTYRKRIKSDKERIEKYVKNGNLLWDSEKKGQRVGKFRKEAK